MIYEIYKSMAESSFDESNFMDNKIQPKGRDNTDIKIQIASLYDEYEINTKVLVIKANIKNSIITIKLIINQLYITFSLL